MGRQALRYAAGISGYRADAKFREMLGRENWQKWQQRKVHELMQYAVRHIPFYYGRACGKTAEHAMDVLATWPLLDKDQIKEAGDALLSKKILLRFPTYTSGTTGTPLTLYRTPSSAAFEQVLIERQLHWAGWRQGDRRVWLRGDQVVPLQDWGKPFWRRNSAENMLVCSSFHLRDDTIAQYIEAMEAFDPVVIQAYPSSIACIARWLLQNGQRYQGRSLKGVVTSSEMLADAARREISTAFNVAVFDWYGQSERVGAIGTCTHGSYHIIEDSGFVELLPKSPGTADLVGTGFGNLAMPLLRFRTADTVLLKNHEFRCGCGTSYRVVEKIIGRENDRIITSDGREHIMLDFIFDEVAGLKEAQILQEKIDEIHLCVVLYPGFNLSDMSILKDRARQRLGAHVQVHLRQMERIERTSAGKVSLIVNKLIKSGISAQQ